MAALAIAPAQAEDFFKGKTISIVHFSGPGGVNDLYAHIFSRYLPQYIPGNPQIIVQVLPGAGGKVLANYLYNKAPRDGTYIGSLNQVVGVDQVLGTGVQYNTAEFGWIGRVTPTTGLVMIYHTSPVKKLEDMKTHETVFGAQGKPSQTYMTPTLMRTLMGYKTRVVLGYTSSPEMFAAMERGEVEGRTGALETLLAVHPDWLKQGKMRIVAELSLEKEPTYPGVPLLPPLIKNPAKRQIMDLIASYTAFGICFAAPPGLPEDRLQILRDAYEKTVRDPHFLEDIKKAHMDVRSLPGKDLQALSEQFKHVSADLLARTKAALQ
jgi:tripartite-type tricarboxylate transporter receptor subunit TctC